MKTTNRAIVALAAALLTASLPAAFGAGTMTTKSITAKPVKVPTARGTAANPNIKTDMGKNVMGKPAAAPPSKGGAKSRGGFEYTAHIDNRTGWQVNCYINGTFVGVVGPYADLYPSVTEGQYHYYCRAPFTDGSYLDWTSEPTTGNSVFHLHP